jgi:hypothetical protein
VTPDIFIEPGQLDFKTTEYSLTIAVVDDSFTHEQDAVLEVAGRPEPFHHADRNTLRPVASPTANPAAIAR